MSILFISFVFPPSNQAGGQRSYFFAKYLKETSNIDAHVLTPNPNCVVSKMGQSDWADLENFEIPVHQTNYPSFRRKLGSLPKIKRMFFPDPQVQWKGIALRAAKKLLKANPDITHIFTSSPWFSDHLIALELKRNSDFKWIADFRDFHWLHARQNQSNRKTNKRHKNLENEVLTEADNLIFISETMMREYASKYPFITEKSHAIYNGFDAKEFSSPHIDSTETLKIFYAGSFYDGLRNPHLMLSAIDQLLDENKIQNSDFEINIAGPKEPRALSRIRNYRCADRVRFLGILPRKQVLKQMLSSDLLWLIVADKLSHSTGIPLKCFEYMAAKKPILTFCPKGCETEMALRSCGHDTIFDGQTDTNCVADQLLELFNAKKTGQLPALNSGLRVEERFTRRFQAAQLGAIISSLH